MLFYHENDIDAFFDIVSDAEDIVHLVMTWKCYCLLFNRAMVCNPFEALTKL